MNDNYDHDKTSMWAENTNLVQEVPIIHFSHVKATILYIKNI